MSRSGTEEIRLFVDIVNHTRESLWDDMTAEEIIRVCRAMLASGWDIYPDQWTQRQLDECLEHNTVPRWDDNEKPIHGAP